MSLIFSRKVATRPGEVPERLRQVVDEKWRQVQKLQLSFRPEKVESGQLWTLHLWRGSRETRGQTLLAPRLAVVLEVGSSGQLHPWVRLAAVSVETAGAGIFDLLVPRAQSPIGCSFIVECWNVEIASPHSLHKAVGRLGKQTMRDMLALSRAYEAGVAPAGISGLTGAVFAGAASREQVRFQARERKAVRETLIPFP
jgi:hypothetical protein